VQQSFQDELIPAETAAAEAAPRESAPALAEEAESAASPEPDAVKS
jgi:hypothetical protein